MFPHPGKTIFTYAADDGAGGGAAPSTELPEHLKDRYISVDKFNGTKGALEQQITRWRSEAEKVAGEKSALEGQLKTFEEQMKGLQTQAASVGDLTAKLGELTNGLEGQTALNARLKTVLKFPALLAGDLAPSTMAIIESSTLDTAALEEHLGKMASVIGAAVAPAAAAPPPDTTAGATPPQPRGTQVKPNDLMLEAENLRRSGDLNAWNLKMQEALQLLDADSKFMPPKPADVMP